MIGEGENPQITQMDADSGMPEGNAPDISAPDTSALDAPMSWVREAVGGKSGAVVGYEELVERVMRLEAIVESLVPGSLTPPDRAVHDDIGSAEIETNAGEVHASVDSIVLRAWYGTALSLRLKFVREMLGQANPCQAILREAQSLEELRNRGAELETWLTGYPSLFADAVERLEDRSSCGAEAAESLAQATLEEARQEFAAAMTAMHIDWIVPQVGDRIDAEHEVVGEEEAPVLPGCVARLRRRGFRRAGHVVLLAQVTRALPQTREAQSVPTEHKNVVQPIANVPPPDIRGPQITLGHPTPANIIPTPAPQRPTPSSPDWLRTFLQRSAGCGIPAIQRLGIDLGNVAQAVLQCEEGAIAEIDMAERLEPLLPLLSAPHVPSFLGVSGEWGDLAAEARDRLLEWLALTLQIVPIAPSMGEPCDAATMQTVSTRRTAHAHEDGAVAKVERIGLRRDNRVLFRAQVLRYELRAGYE